MDYSNFGGKQILLTFPIQCFFSVFTTLQANHDMQGHKRLVPFANYDFSSVNTLSIFLIKSSLNLVTSVNTFLRSELFYLRKVEYTYPFYNYVVNIFVIDCRDLMSFLPVQ